MTGTYKMRPHPFMRPALAAAGAALREAGAKATLRGGAAFRKRAALRQKLRKAVKQGKLTAAEARAESRRIRAPRSRRRRR